MTVVSKKTSERWKHKNTIPKVRFPGVSFIQCVKTSYHCVPIVKIYWHGNKKTLPDYDLEAVRASSGIKALLII